MLCFVNSSPNQILGPTTRTLVVINRHYFSFAQRCNCEQLLSGLELLPRINIYHFIHTLGEN